MDNEKTDAQKNGEKTATSFSAGSNFYRGLTKREHLAGQALNGMITKHNGAFHKEGMKDIATDAVMFADLLLTELEKNQ